MADIHDLHEATVLTDDMLRNLEAAGDKAEDAGDMLGVIVALGFDAVALAVREASVRADYVARDEGKRRGHG